MIHRRVFDFITPITIGKKRKKEQKESKGKKEDINDTLKKVFFTTITIGKKRKKRNRKKRKKVQMIQKRRNGKEQ